MTQARWLVQIDWNGDGDFSDPREDVTPDVLGMTLEHLRDLSSEHIEAARLELELKNHDHKYMARRRQPRTVLNLVVPAGSRANAMLLLHRSISDRVAVRYPEMGIDGHFFIEGHRIIVEDGGTRATRELLLQSV